MVRWDSIIDEMPVAVFARKRVGYDHLNWRSVLDWARQELAKVILTYVICPLIEESEMLDVKNATEIYEQLQAYFAPNYQVGILHGKMKNIEKDEIMEEFKDNQATPGSTTVIQR